ncbi:unnamed protein product [Diamesa hyperborea]
MSESPKAAVKRVPQNKNLQFKKRVPTKSFQRSNDIYITNKTDFKAQLKKCEEIVNSEKSEVFLHCIGNAINRGINLALRLADEYSFSFEANTSTIQLVDDHHPLNDEEDFSINKRLNSCLHIRVFRQYKMNKTAIEPEKLIKV